MRRLLQPILLCWMLAIVVAMPVFAAPPTPMLWKVSRGSNTVYMLGSMHFLKDDDYPLSPDVDAAYRQANRLVFEIAPDEINSPATAGLILQHGMYSDASHTLQGELPASVWKRVVAYGAKNGLPEPMLQKFAPWMLAITMIQLELPKMGMNPDSGLDMHFMKKAAADHKPTAGLETPDQQLSIFYDAPLSEQQEFLEESLDEMDHFQQEMDAEHAGWRRGDGEALAAQAKEEFARYPDLYGKLVLDRNRNFVAQVEKMLAANGQTNLMIVGALHLSGPDGVVNQMRLKGYGVERICTGCVNVH